MTLSTCTRPSAFEPALTTLCRDPARLIYPLEASPKLDGVRCLVLAGQALGAELTPIPNRHIAERLARLPAFDGEIVVGNPRAVDAWARTIAAVMRPDGLPEFTYWVFDTFADDWADKPFRERLAALAEALPALGRVEVQLAPHQLALSARATNELERIAVASGYDGLILRDPAQAYRCGQPAMVKLKRWIPARAVLIDVVPERRRNTPEATSLTGARAAEIVIAWRMPAGEILWPIATGLSPATCVRLMTDRADLIGRHVNIRYEMAETGRPKSVVYLGIAER